MRAVRLQSVGEIGTVTVDPPEPGPGEVMVRVEAAGICGTDRHLFRGEFPCRPPVILGHEFAGIVVACGSGVDLAEGTRVACDPNDWCGDCDPCRAGRVNLCRRYIATGVQRNGGFAEFATFPARKAHVLPGDLDPVHGAFCEPLSCTIHGVDIGAPRAGERVIVVGGGVIGLMAVQLARLAGAEVMILTRDEGKQGLARSLGAEAAVATEGEALSIWAGGADLVLECAGVAATVAMAPRLTRVGGRVVILGVLAPEERVGIAPFDLLTREIQMHFAFLNPFTMARAAELIVSGRVAVDPLVTRRIGLEDASGVIAVPAPRGEIRAIVVPGMV